jgi:hypothetical protein
MELWEQGGGARRLRFNRGAWAFTPEDLEGRLPVKPLAQKGEVLVTLLRIKGDEHEVGLA